MVQPLFRLDFLGCAAVHVWKYTRSAPAAHAACSHLCVTAALAQLLQRTRT